MIAANRPSDRSMGFVKRVLAVSVAAMVFGLVLRGGGPNWEGAPASSAENYDPEGWAAAYRVLDALGFEVELWDRAPSELPTGPALLWMAAVPTDYGDLLALGETGGEGEAPGDRTSDPALEALARAGHHPSHYRRFVDSGGILLLPSAQESLDFLADGLGYRGFAEARVTLEKAHGPSVTLPDGRGYRVSQQPRRWSVPRYERVRGEAFARRRTLVSSVGTPWVEIVPLGHGGIVLHPFDAHLRNGAIGEEEHAALLVGLCSELGRGVPVYFDEYALGRGREWGLLELVFQGPARIAAMHWIALGLMAFWWFVTPRAFRRATPGTRRRATEERVHSRAGWMAREEARSTTFDRATEAVLLQLLREVGGSLVPMDAQEDSEAASNAESKSRGSVGDADSRRGSGQLDADELARRRRIPLLLAELSRALGLGDRPPEDWPLQALIHPQARRGRRRLRSLGDHYRILDAFEERLRRETRLGALRPSTPATRGETLSP